MLNRPPLPRPSANIFRALSLYKTRVYLLGNSQTLLTAFFFILSIRVAILIHNTQSDGSPPASDDAHIYLTFMMFLAAFLNTVLLHARNQIFSPQAPTIPGFLKAESRAALIVVLTGLCILTALITYARIHILNAAFFILVNAIPFLSLWYTSSPQTSGRTQKIVATLCFMLCMAQFVLSFLVPDYIVWLLTCPPVLTIPGCLILLALSRTCILNLPNQIYTQNAVSVLELRQSRIEVTSKPLPFFQLRQRLLEPASNITLRNSILANLTFPFLSLLLTAFLNTRFTSLPSPKNWFEAAKITTYLFGFSSPWIVERSHWPALLITGRFGTRLQFVKAVFTAQLVFLCATVPFRVFSMLTPLVIFCNVPLKAAALCGLILGSFAFSSPFLSALPAALDAKPSKQMLTLFKVIPLLLIGFFNPFVMPPVTSGIFALVFLTIATLAFLIAPRRLARADWPYETEPTP